MSPLENSTNLAARMGRWSARRRKTAIFGWLAFVAAAAVIGATFGTTQLDPDDNAVGESKRAEEILAAGGFADLADESILVTSNAHTAGEPAFRAVLADVARAVSGSEGVSDVQPPLVSEDRHAALVRFELSDADGEAVSRVEPVLGALAAVQDRHEAFRVEAFGDASAQLALEETIQADFTRAEYTALPVTLGILVVVFGALVAAGIPLLVGLSAVLAAIGLLALPSRLFAMDEAANSVILLIGLAVSVDYSLFYLKREREERTGGKGEQAALAVAAATSGRAILISGMTVIAAVAGMFFGGSAIWTSVAIGTILVVAIAVVGSLTCRRRSAGSATASRGAASRFCRAGRGAPSPASGEASSTASCGGPPSPPPSPAGCWWRSPCRHSSCARRSPASTRCRGRSRSFRPTSASRSPSPAARCPRSSRSEPRT
jgi:uncharacterized membrane protein YdfJ with MMPL/SSD domain